jgi:uncharacterized coiled-coil protein SlyX
MIIIAPNEDETMTEKTMTDKNMIGELEPRLAALEEMLTHQSLAIEELSKQMHMAEQARETLAQNHKALFEMVQHIDDKTADGAAALPREKPPHY